MGATLLIMAAGLGSRFGGNKQIAAIGPNNEILMEYAIYDAVEAGFDEVVFVIRRSMLDTFREHIGDKIARRVKVSYSFQEADSLPSGFTPPRDRTKPYGTTHAVACAKALISKPFAVINADDYYGKTAFQTIYNALKSMPETNHACMVAYQLKNTVSENGAVTRGVCECNAGGNLVKVTETYKILPCQDGSIRDFNKDDEGAVLNPNAPVSMNFWGFTPWIFDKLNHYLASFLDALPPDDLKQESPLPVCIDALMAANEITVKVLQTDAVWFGVTYPEDKAFVQDALKKLHDADAYPIFL